MNVIKISFPIFLFIIISSCSGQPKEKLATVKKSTIILNKLKSIPAEIEGCSCYFSESKSTYKKEQYIFISSFDGYAFLSVNGKLQKFKVVKSGRKPDTFGDYDHTEVYQNDFYTVTVNIKYINSDSEETWLNQGTITILNKAGEKIVKSFYGECGC